MLEEILPPSASVAASRVDLDAPLFPAEEKSIERAVEKRRREFVTARACAHTALERLGVQPQAILSGPQGAPRWPTGIVGSITHCEGYRASAVARRDDLVTIGVDAEPNQPLPRGVLARIALPREREWVGELAGAAPAVCWDRLLFCMKEAVYKAWFPLAERWLGFEDAVITVDQALEKFEARLLVEGPSLGGSELTGFSGRWLARDGLVLAAIAMPAVSAPEIR